MAGSTPASATGDAATATVRPPQLDEGARGVLGLAAHRTAEMAGAPIGLVGRRSVSPWGEAWRRFKRHKLAVMSLFVLAFMVLAVLLGPVVWQVAINEIDFTARLKARRWRTRSAPTTSARTSWRACCTAGASRWPWASRRC